MSTGLVHWHEGLFLQPHHLQAMQRGLLHEMAAERRLTWSYPYGMVEARLSSDALENMLIQFDSLRVVMPSGLEVRVPENAHLPALDIRQRFKAASEPILITLAVPLWHAGRANTIEIGSDNGWAKRLYRVEEIESPDENTGDNPQPMRMRRINARLLMDDDDPSDMEVLPLMKIQPPAGGEGALPRVDEHFIPPCMVTGGWPTLREMLRDIANFVEASRRDLVRLMTRDRFSADMLRGRQMVQLMRLRTINRFAARLPHLVSAHGVSPFLMYLELREMVAELAALHPDRDPFQIGSYDHDNPAPVFIELTRRIRELCRPEPEGTVLEVPLVREDRVLVAELAEEHITSPNEYFLGVRTKDDPRALAELIEDKDKFKLMPYSLRGKKVYGVPLEREHNPPVQLPAEAGLHYFRLLRDQNARWEQIGQEKKLVVEGRDVDSSSYEMTLYMTVPTMGS